ncbi:MAG: hypothetical protein JXA67_22295 [Micromonosporaceae bacterium]|nr:hypothetical protein [Micromonosporaceae bacterium]
MLTFIVLGGLAVLAVGLVLGFFLGKQASLWCPACGQSSLSDSSSRRQPVSAGARRPGS